MYKHEMTITWCNQTDQRKSSDSLEALNPSLMLSLRFLVKEALGNAMATSCHYDP